MFTRDTTFAPAPDGRGPATASPTPARWIGRDGLEHTGLIPVPEPRKAGQQASAWVDRANHVVAQPATPGDAFVLAVAASLLVAFTEVEVNKGVVKLSGNVPSRREARLATEFVERIEGVVSLMHSLTYDVDDRRGDPTMGPLY